MMMLPNCLWAFSKTHSKAQFYICFGPPSHLISLAHNVSPHDGVKPTLCDSTLNLKEKNAINAKKKQGRSSGERVCSATVPPWGETNTLW